MNYPLGWITPPERTREQEGQHAAAMAKMPPRFQIVGAAPDPGPLVNLMELWSHPSVIEALGYEFPGIHQITGSCVGAGGGNVGFTLSCVECIRLGEPEQIILPFWLYTYGLSRMLAGMNGPGEGSLGSTFAEAAGRHGWFSQGEQGLPAPENTDGLIWGQQIELQWSNGRAIADKWLSLGKTHLVRTVSPLTTGDQARMSIRNLYPVTFASNWFIQPGSERLKGSGSNAAVVGTLNANGGHQTSLLAIWDNPELGPLAWNQNQWGLDVYKKDPTTKRSDGCWMPLSEVDRAVKRGYGEVFAFSQHDGYPAQMVSWANILPKPPQAKPKGKKK
jgi:hypothetical protein